MPSTADRRVAAVGGRLWRLAVPVFGASLLGGCAGMSGFDVNADLSSMDLYSATEYVSTPSDRVLNHMRTGLALFEAGDLRGARNSFEIAYRAIETIYADNDSARRARSVWHAEAVKDFRGEPYERAAVGYYLGLIDMASGDYENARASFKWGMLQDTMSYNESYRADMAILAYLRGWAAMCSSASASAASEDFEEFRALRPDLPVPQPDHNLLLVGELGGAPQKLGKGRYSHVLGYRTGYETAAKQVRYFANEQRIEPARLEDLYWQATTLGGRYVDGILAGKAAFKENLEDTSAGFSTAAVTSLQMASVTAAHGRRDETIALGTVALASAVASLASSMAADNVEPAADTRAWDNLPRFIHASSTHVAQMPEQVMVSFRGEDGSAVKSSPVRVRSAGRCGFAWAREIPALAVAQRGVESAFASRVYQIRHEQRLRKERGRGVPSF